MSVMHRINLSTAWRPPADAGGAWVRRFGWPAGLAAGDRVWLVAVGVGTAALECNGVGLPAGRADAVEWRHDITPLLARRNELVLVPAAATWPAGDGRPTGPLAAGDHRPLDPGLGRFHLEIVPAGAAGPA